MRMLIATAWLILISLVSVNDIQANDREKNARMSSDQRSIHRNRDHHLRFDLWLGAGAFSNSPGRSPLRGETELDDHRLVVLHALRGGHGHRNTVYPCFDRPGRRSDSVDIDQFGTVPVI